MRKRTMAIIISIVILAVLLSFWGLPFFTSNNIINQDFENGMGDWLVDADVPADPNSPGNLVEWNITRISGDGSNVRGEYSLNFSIDGRQDDGTIWIERRVETSGRVIVELSFDFYSEQESFNTLAAVVAYAGVKEPEFEGDFAVVGAANQVSGWKRYSYSAEVDANRELWVALGISVRWETFISYNVDNVEIEIIQ